MICTGSLRLGQSTCAWFWVRARTSKRAPRMAPRTDQISMQSRLRSMDVRPRPTHKSTNNRPAKRLLVTGAGQFALCNSWSSAIRRILPNAWNIETCNRLSSAIDHAFHSYKIIPSFTAVTSQQPRSRSLSDQLTSLLCTKHSRGLSLPDTAHRLLAPQGRGATRRVSHPETLRVHPVPKQPHRE